MLSQIKLRIPIVEEIDKVLKKNRIKELFLMKKTFFRAVSFSELHHLRNKQQTLM